MMNGINWSQVFMLGKVLLILLSLGHPCFGQDIKDKYEVLADGTIVVKDCDIEFPRPGCGEEVVGFYKGDTIQGERLVQIYHNHPTCNSTSGSGDLVPLKGNAWNIQVPYYGKRILMKDLPLYTYVVRGSNGQTGMRFKFNFRPGACSDSPPPRKSIKSAVPPREPPATPGQTAPSKKAGSKVPQRMPPPSMPWGTSPGGADADGISAQ